MNEWRMHCLALSGSSWLVCTSEMRLYGELWSIQQSGQLDSFRAASPRRAQAVVTAQSLIMKLHVTAARPINPKPDIDYLPMSISCLRVFICGTKPIAAVAIAKQISYPNHDHSKQLRDVYAGIPLERRQRR